MRELHVRSNRVTGGAQIDIEGDGLAPESTFYVVYPNNSRATAKVINADEKGVTIKVDNQQIRARRATAADNPVPTCFPP